MDFVAIDFETANEKRNSACAIGLTIVKDNKIVEEKYYLINPCEMRFLPMNIWIHGINPEDVENEKNFSELWSEIKPIIDGKLIIAHNASFDISVLRNTLSFYDIEHPNIRYACTVHMAKGYYVDLPNHKLNTISEALGFDLKHHHAGSDASAAANIVLNICKDLGISKEEDLIEIMKLKLGNVERNFYTPCKSLGKPEVNKKLINFNKFNNKKIKNKFFENKTVVFTGPLESMKRVEAMIKVKNLGGKVGSSVTKSTNFLVTGIKNFKKLNYENKSSKMKKAESLIRNGQDIYIMSEKEFLLL
ncbi:exonuclease domain-containing protein, partial [Clostridium tarantellae]